MLELRDGPKCHPEAVVGMNVGLACVDGVIAVLAFYQLMRIQSRNSHLGWTRQKVFHLIIGSSNLGYFLYFVLNPIAACKGWSCWPHSCGFSVTAFPKILLMAAFLLLLSFWLDLCHQSDDVEEEDECSSQDLLLDKTHKTESSSGGHRRRCSFRCTQIGSRQKVVILVTVLVFVIMMVSAVLIWIGEMGKSPVDSAVVSQVYVDLIAVVFILLGGALAFYGLLLFLKMRRVRSDRASSDMWKVAGLAMVSVICFTSSSSVAMATNIPLFYHWHGQTINAISTSLLLVLYYFIGSSVPSAFLLFVMRELPPVVISRQEESRTITFVAGRSVETRNPQCWTAAARSVQNQVSRVSPI